jgi:LysM repeat protein
MNGRRGCIKRIAVALSVLTALACVVLGAFAFLYVRQQQARAQFEPPSVTITYPESGTSTLEGSYLPVAATAFGGIPITRAELWVDGQLIDTQQSRDPEGVSPFYVSFDLTVPQGLHTLFVRAVNAMGIMGDSWPVNVGGVERPGPDEPAVLVTVEEGETLEDIAAAYDVDPETVRQLNPGLGDQEPPPGSEVVLPLPRSHAAPGPQGPAVGPSLPPSGIQPPDSGPLPPPTGPRLDVIAAAPIISPRDIIDLVMAGSAPAAPTDLQAEVTGCNIHLRWNDNADNEAWYEVKYLWNLGQDPRAIAQLAPGAGGQVWFEFPAPDWGAFIFWVEAVNFWGRQPSNKVGALVLEGDCPRTLATHLQIEVLDMTVPAGYDDVYCYLSFEGAVPVRVPEIGYLDEWVPPALGGEDVPPWLIEETGLGTPISSEVELVALILVVPIPGDEWLEIGGECWGWPDELSEIGPLSGQYPRQTWDGARLSLAGSGLEFGLAIHPLEGALDTSGLMTTFSYDDPMMKVPYDVSDEMPFSLPAMDPLLRVLTWKWDGDPNDISGFQILLNGFPYNADGGWSLVDPTYTSALVRLPKLCGGRISWQVRAIAGEAQSLLSARTPKSDYTLPSCPEQGYAMVKFHSIGIHFADYVDGDCDPFIPAWFVEVNGQAKVFDRGTCDEDIWTFCGVRGRPVTGCGPYSLAEFYEGTDPYFDTVVVEIPKRGIHIEVAQGLWDLSNGELRGADWDEYDYSSLEEAQLDVGCGDTDSWGYYTLYIFPQPEGMNCPVSGPLYIP